MARPALLSSERVRRRVSRRSGRSRRPRPIALPAVPYAADTVTTRSGCEGGIARLMPEDARGTVGLRTITDAAGSPPRHDYLMPSSDPPPAGPLITRAHEYFRRGPASA